MKFSKHTYSAQEIHMRIWISNVIFLPFFGAFGTFQHFHLDNNNSNIYNSILLL
jgi:hypothetical protein